MPRGILTVRMNDTIKKKLKEKGDRLAKKKKVSSANNMIEIALEKISKQSDLDFEQYYL